MFYLATTALTLSYDEAQLHCNLVFLSLSLRWSFTSSCLLPAEASAGRPVFEESVRRVGMKEKETKKKKKKENDMGMTC